MQKTVPVQVIAVVSGKGGSGKTQTSINLAYALAARGRRVLLWDGNFSMPGVAVALNLEPAYSIADVLAHQCSLQEALCDTPFGFQVLPGAPLGHARALNRAHIYGLIQAFNTLDPVPDVVLIDCAPGMGDDVLFLAQAATERLIVIEDDPANVFCALQVLYGLQERYGVGRFRLVVNRVQAQDEGLNLHEQLLLKEGFPEGVVLDFSGEIYLDDMVQRSVQRQLVFCEAFPRSRVALAFRKIAEQIDAWPLPAHPRGAVELFTERLVRVQLLGQRTAK